MAGCYKSVGIFILCIQQKINSINFQPVIRIKEDDIFSLCFSKSVISCGRYPFIVLMKYFNPFVLIRITLRNFQSIVRRAVINYKNFYVCVCLSD